MTCIARRAVSTPSRLQAERLIGEQALREAQALRFRVFSHEFGAQLQGGEQGLDQDDYDPHCQHIGVRDHETGELVATTRLLDHHAARRLGRFYSEDEFRLHGLSALEGPLLEIGRTCVDARYRNGATIGVLWGELADVLNQGDYRYLMGCASIPMRDGGVQAQAVMQRLRERYLCTDNLHAEPKTPLPTLSLPDNVIAELPPLLKAYMRLGAKICGEPCWDADFQVADVFILLKREDLCPRYARHFKAAV
jgi:putative hemolysin